MERIPSKRYDVRESNGGVISASGTHRGERSDVEWESVAVAAHHRLQCTPVCDERGDPSEEWIGEHEKFHAALAAGCVDRLIDRPRPPAAGVGGASPRLVCVARRTARCPAAAAGFAAHLLLTEDTTGNGLVVASWQTRGDGEAVCHGTTDGIQRGRRP